MPRFEYKVVNHELTEDLETVQETIKDLNSQKEKLMSDITTNKNLTKELQEYYNYLLFFFSRFHRNNTQLYNFLMEIQYKINEFITKLNTFEWELKIVDAMLKEAEKDEKTLSCKMCNEYIRLNDSEA